jgi:UDP-glucose 4-epimerase
VAGVKKIFITGGAGFIGSTLIGKLVEKNQIVAYDNLARNALQNKPWRDHKNLKLVVGDVLDAGALAAAMEGANIIVHCAAIAGIDTVVLNPVRTMRVNMVGSANVLEAAAQLKNLDRVVCFSTSEVFGTHGFRSSELDKTSIGVVGEARWTYAVSKLAEEHLAIAYFHHQKLPVTVVRPFNVYGPGQVGEGALRTFIQHALKNEPITINGDGTQIRAWCFVDDMVRGTMLHGAPAGRRRILQHRQPACGHDDLRPGQHRDPGAEFQVEIQFVHKDYVDVELRIPNVSKARELIGFEAEVDLDEGIAPFGGVLPPMRRDCISIRREIACHRPIRCQRSSMTRAGRDRRDHVLQRGAEPWRTWWGKSGRN